MSRPESFNDIPIYSRTGATLITVELNELAVSSKVLAAAAALLAAVEKTPGVSSNQQHGTITVTKDKTPEELSESVRMHQNEWDNLQKSFLEWAEFSKVPDEIGNWAIYNVLAWARKELPDTDLTWLTEAHKAAKIRDASK